MKRVLSIMALLMAMFVFSNLQAQTPQVNNPGFETWTDLGTADVEPTDWNSFMTATGTWSSFGAKQVDRSSQKRPGSAGSYSAVIWARDAGLAMANGNLTTGQIKMGSTTPSSNSNYNFSIRSDAAFSEAFTAHPDSLVVWVRTKISNVAHQPRIHAVIHDNGYDLRDPVDATSATHVVAEATLNYTTTANVWVRKSIPFVYAGPASTPAYVLISMTTCKDPGTGTDGDSVYFDDLQFIYNPTLTTGVVATGPYYVDQSTGASVSIPFTLTGTMYAGNNVIAQLSDASGSFASPVVIGSLATTTSGTITGTIPANTPDGSAYRIRVVSTNYAVTAADNGSNIQIELVSSAISPDTTQHIEVSTDGTQLTVVESPAGISREWKFSTVSGGPYSSFALAETNTTYTPNFGIANTYYVIAESIISTFTVTSPEVIVIVSPLTGIADNEKNTVSISWNQQDFNVDLTQSVFENPTLVLTDMNGRIVANADLNGKTFNRLHIDLSTGIYGYSIRDKANVVSGKIFHK